MSRGWQTSFWPRLGGLCQLGQVIHLSLASPAPRADTTEGPWRTHQLVTFQVLAREQLFIASLGDTAIVVTGYL